MSPESGDRLLLLFIDGVGLGPQQPDINPLAAAATPVLDDLLGGSLTEVRSPLCRQGLTFTALDATLGYPGLPQSATGQTTLLTGLNGAALMGWHYGPWPGPTLKAALDRGTLFHAALSAGLTACLANAYPPGYFRALEQGRLKPNAPAYAAMAASLALLDLEAYRQGRALAADLTGSYLKGLDSSLPAYTPAGAGAALAEVAAAYHFTFFDFWLPDRLGHRGSWVEALGLVERFDAFLGGLIEHLGSAVTLLVTSDHGNLEDKSTTSHTRASVPLLAWGRAAGHFCDLRDLPAVAPAVLQALHLR